MHGGVSIHYLTKNRFKAILEPNPYIEKVWGIEKSTNEIIEELKSANFDYIVDLHKNLRSARVKRSLKLLSFSFDKLNWEKWVLVNFGINRLPELHIVDRYMAALKPFGIENDEKGLDYFIPASAELEKDDLPESHQTSYVVVVIGAAHWRKKPRIGQYISLCVAIQSPVVLLGGPEDSEWGEEIAAKTGSHVWNAAGKFSLHGSAWLIRESRLVITPDTGLMHIAAAFKKPIISLWGATVPDFGMYPYRNEALNLMLQADHLKKRPCSKLGTRCKYRECRCIEEIPIEKAAEVANQKTRP
jgi:heptosyltransferase-2